jgi:site-specific recombinase XerC
MAKRNVEKIATGIYQNEGIVIRVGTKDVRKDGEGRRFTDKHYTDAQGRPDVRKLVAARHLLLGHAGIQSTKDLEQRTSFAAEVTTFANTFASKNRKRDVLSLMQHWIGVFGDRQRRTLTTVEIDKQLALWAAKPESTRYHLRQVLSQMFRKLDGKNAANPVAEVNAIKPRYDAPRALPYDLIEEIIGEMGDTDSKVRARLMAYTGLPQAQIKKMHPTHVNFIRWTYQVKARRKGGGAPAVMLPMILPTTKKAFQAFAERGCWGPFSSSSYAKRWREACDIVQARWKKDGKMWPVDFDPRAYDLRHSFLTEIFRVTGDLNTVHELAQHATMDQTKRYMQGAVSETMVASLKKAKRAGAFKVRTPKKSDVHHVPPRPVVETVKIVPDSSSTAPRSKRVH